MSLNTKKIEYAAHKDWFLNILRQKNSLILMVNIDNDLVGMVRYDYNMQDKSAEISINIAPEFRGKNLSVNILSSAILNKSLLVRKFTAIVKNQI